MATPKHSPFELTKDVIPLIHNDDPAFLDQALAMHQEEVASGAMVEIKAGALISALGVAGSLLVASGAILFTAGESPERTQWPTDVAIVYLVVAVGMLAGAFHSLQGACKATMVWCPR